MTGVRFISTAQLVSTIFNACHDVRDQRPIVQFAYCDTSEKDSGGPGHTIVNLIGIDDFVAFAHWFAALFGWNPRIAETLGMNAIHFPIMPPMILLSAQYSTD